MEPPTNPETTMDRTDYLACFDTLHDAIEFEETILGTAAEFLPQCALAVIEGEEPTEAYWAFLYEQRQEWEADEE